MADSDRPGLARRRALRSAAAALVALVLGAAPAPAAGPEATAAALLASARADLEAGESAAALQRVRELRARFPDDPLVAEALALSVHASLAAADPLRARYYLGLLAVRFPASPSTAEAAMTVGDRLYAEAEWAVALEAYRVAIAVGGRGDIDRALLRAAEIELHHGDDRPAARELWRAARPEHLEPADRELYRRLGVTLAWEFLSPARLGLPDINVSSLLVDGDDLWIGTWNGGTARWSLSAAASDAFPLPASPRGFVATDRRVWVATFDGLYGYSRGSGRWSPVEELAGVKVQSVALAAGEPYAGTLGEGLYRLRGEAWERVGDDAWPGRFITCLAPFGDRLLVGTMNLGLFVLEPASGLMLSLGERLPAFTPRNITAALADRRGRVWIGTYGEGLWLWEGGTVRRFGGEGGQLGDDWVLAICETDRGVWFGTFGAGASRLDEDGRWSRLGVADGLPSLDVAAIASRGSWVYLGTLGAGVCAWWERGDGPQP